MKENKQHPHLQSLYRLHQLAFVLLYLCIVLFGCIAGIGIALAIMLDHVYPLILTIVSMVAAWITHRCIKKWRKKENIKFQDGNYLLSTVSAEKMKLHFANAISWSGPVAVVANRGGKTIVIAFQASKFHYPPVGESDVDVYHHPTREYMLLSREGKLIFACSYTRVALLREFRIMQSVFLWLTVFVMLMFIGGGGYFAKETYDSYKDAQRAKHSIRWLPTECQIISSELEETEVKKRSGEIATMYQALVQYQYDIENHRYTGHRIYYSHRPSYNYEKENMLVEKYTPGAVIPLRYNPEVHGESVLEAGRDEYANRIFQSNLYGTIAMFVSGIIVTVMLWYFFIHRNLRQIREYFEKL